ncbi:DUF4124 domain-containing protein [Faucicola atlantae]|uniref:DUF4124 domain-containing protein n=1 Tax=Faucicola atlantae TaxID=34059 RepID=UPI0025B0D159|nr:DUF4124 domain-containing protein [Moraxella atlantae]
MRNAITYSLLIAASCIGAMSHAATYYKWIDPNGVPHYSQYAPTQGVDLKKVQVINTREMAMASAGGNSNANNGVPASPVGATQTAEQRRIAELEAQNKAQQKEQDKERCKTLQANLQNMNAGGRVYEMAQNGERKYLDGREIELRRQQIQQAINQYCKG